MIKKTKQNRKSYCYIFSPTQKENLSSVAETKASLPLRIHRQHVHLVPHKADVFNPNNPVSPPMAGHPGIPNWKRHEASGGPRRDRGRRARIGGTEARPVLREDSDYGERRQYCTYVLGSWAE